MVNNKIEKSEEYENEKKSKIWNKIRKLNIGKIVNFLEISRIKE